MNLLDAPCVNKMQHGFGLTIEMPPGDPVDTVDGFRNLANTS